MSASSTTERGTGAEHGIAGSYDPDGRVNLAGHTASMAAYAVLVAGALLVGRKVGAPRTRPSALDVLVGGVATHKLSRLVAKGSVTSPVRAPFTEFEGTAGPAEHREIPRGVSGVRHTVGELLTCPFCLAVWLGTAYLAVLSVAPRLARAVAAVFSVVAISDWLQLGYEIARRKATTPEE